MDHPGDGKGEGNLQRHLGPPEPLKVCRSGNDKCKSGDECPCGEDCDCNGTQCLDLTPPEACCYGNDKCWGGDTCSCGSGCNCGTPIPRQCVPCKSGNEKCWGGDTCSCDSDCTCGTPQPQQCCSKVQRLDPAPGKACKGGDKCSCGSGCTCGIPIPRQCVPCKGGNENCWGGDKCPCTDCCCDGVKASSAGCKLCPIPSDTPGLSSITCSCGAGYYKPHGTTSTWVSGADVQAGRASPKPGT